MCSHDSCFFILAQNFTKLMSRNTLCRPSPLPPPLEGRSTVAMSAQPLVAESTSTHSHPSVAGSSFPINVPCRPLPPPPPLPPTVRPMMAVSYQYLVAESAFDNSQPSVALSSPADTHSLVAGSSSARTHEDSRNPKRSRSQKRRDERKRSKLNAIASQRERKRSKLNTIASQQIWCPV